MSPIGEARAFARGVRRHWRSTSLVIVTLAGSIALNLILFEAIRQLLFLPPQGIREATGLVRITSSQLVDGMGWVPSSTQSLPVFQSLERDTASWRAAAFAHVEVTTDLSEDDRPIAAAVVSPGYFRVLGTSLALGREWTDGDVSYPVIISHRLWRQRFSMDDRVIGASIRIGGLPHTVVGVAVEGFHGVEGKPVVLWLPLDRHGTRIAGDDWRTNRHSAFLSIVGRLSPELDAESLSRRLNARLRADASAPAGLRAFATPFMERPHRSTISRVRWLLQALALLLFLVAATGTASMLMGRLAQRRETVAIQLALGASGANVWRTALLESMALAGSAAAIALVITWAGSRTIQVWLLPQFAWRENVVTGPVLLIALGAFALVSVLLVALEFLALRGLSVADLLRRHGGTSARQTGRWQLFLLGIQGGVTFALLMGAVLFVRSLHNVRNADLGFDAEHLLVVEADRQDRKPSLDALATATRVSQGLARLPDVSAVATASSIPLERSMATYASVAGRTVQPLATGGPYITGVTGRYFETLGARILAGRDFTADETARRAPVVIVNETMRRTVWPGGDALGQCLLVADDPECHQVVGVVQDGKRDHLREAATLQFYVPHGRAGTGKDIVPAIFVRTRGDADESRGAVIQAARGLGLSWPRIHVLSDLVGHQAREWRMATILFTVYAGIAIVVCWVSIVGALLLAADHHRRELAVRLALGAGLANVASALARPAAGAIVAGVMLAGLATIMLWSRVNGLLFGIAAPQIAGGVVVAAGTIVGAIVLGVVIALLVARVKAVETLRA